MIASNLSSSNADFQENVLTTTPQHLVEITLKIQYLSLIYLHHTGMNINDSEKSKFLI